MMTRGGWRLIVVLVLLTGLVGCQTAVGLTPEPIPVDADWTAVDDFHYQLQRPNPQRIGKTAFDLVVVSIAAAGNSPDTFPALKQSAGGSKIVLAYMSIGQAEIYRSGYVPYVTNRSLGRLRINFGFEPDETPDAYDIQPQTSR